jgi:hypothetical protein
VNSALTVLGSFGVTMGLWLLYRLLIKVLHYLVIRFGLETTAFVVTAQRCDKDGDVYLQGYYTFKDADGCAYTFAFTICTDWPGDEHWRKLMQFYTQGAHNPVRYLRWLPSLHEVQAPM